MSADNPTIMTDVIHDPLAPFVGKKSKRHSPVKTVRPKSIFVAGYKHPRWSEFELWVRKVLEIYVGYKEVISPITLDDGTVKLDAFGRPAQDPNDPAVLEAKIMQHGVKKGAVWFSRETLRQGWFEVFGQVGYRWDARNIRRYEDREEEQRQTYVQPDDDLKRRMNPQVKTSSAHPMDWIVSRMVKDGRLIRAETGKFMFSEALCISVEMYEAWQVHMERGERWEGLDYLVEDLRRADVLPRHRVVVDDATDAKNITFFRPLRKMKGKRNPGHIIWEKVYETLDQHLFFDQDTIHRACLRFEELQGIERNDNRIKDHIHTWHQSGKTERVFPRLYRSAQFNAWDISRRKDDKPIIPEITSWMVKWILYYAPIQARKERRGHDAMFSNSDIRHHFEHFADADWREEFMPELISARTCSARLTDYAKMGYITNATAHRYRIAPATLSMLSPMWQKPEKLVDRKDILMEELAIIRSPLDRAMGMVTAKSASRLIAHVVRKFDLNEIGAREKFKDFARQVKIPPTGLLEMLKDDAA